jgi:hypothetical protein
MSVDEVKAAIAAAVKVPAERIRLYDKDSGKDLDTFDALNAAPRPFFEVARGATFRNLCGSGPSVDIFVRQGAGAKDIKEAIARSSGGEVSPRRIRVYRRLTHAENIHSSNDLGYIVLPDGDDGAELGARRRSKSRRSKSRSKSRRSKSRSKSRRSTSRSKSRRSTSRSKSRRSRR